MAEDYEMKYIIVAQNCFNISSHFQINLFDKILSKRIFLSFKNIGKPYKLEPVLECS